MQIGPGSVVGGKFLIERPLARGGMGSVWAARHVQLGSTVAVKFLDASFAASAGHRQRFEREARAAATLRSPHVVQVSDYGFEGPVPYLIMELLEGEDLGQRLQRVRRMGRHDAARLLKQIGKALRKAHEAGIVHRDLKPANLFLAKVDDEEVVKVLDFGIAKETTSAPLGDSTKTGEVMGSPHYMSPEQVRAEKDVDHRTDLWSLGVILYRMLVGSLPFPGDQLGPVLARIIADPFEPPTRLAPDLPPSIDAFFARALSRDRTQRFQSIGEMVEAFQSAIGLEAPGPVSGVSAPVSAASAALPTMSSGAFAPTMTQGPAALASPNSSSGGKLLTPASDPTYWSAPDPATLPLSSAGAPVGLSPQSGPHAASQSGPLTGTGQQPISASHSGLSATNATARPKGNGLVIGIAAVALVGLLGAAALYIGLRSPSPSPSDTAAAVAPPPGEASPPAASPSLPAVTPSSPVTNEPAAPPTPSAAPSNSAAATTAPTAKPAGDRSKPTGAAATAKPATKEKWF